MENTKEVLAEVRKIGAAEALLAAKLALGFDLIVVVFFWISSGKVLPFEIEELALGIAFAVGLVLFGQLFGRLTALFIHRVPILSWIAGILCAFTTLYLAFSVAGFVFWLERLDNANYIFNWPDVISDMVYTPAFLLVYSCIPVGIHGIVIGVRMSLKIDKLEI